MRLAKKIRTMKIISLVTIVIALKFKNNKNKEWKMKIILFKMEKKVLMIIFSNMKDITINSNNFLNKKYLLLIFKIWIKKKIMDSI